jgi:hypothetical protein
MLFRGKITFYRYNDAKHTATLWGQNAEIWYDKSGDTCKSIGLYEGWKLC